MEFFFSEAPCYSRRVDGVLTVYRSDEDDQLVGCKMKGISQLVKMIERMDVTFNHDRIQLSILFGVSLISETGAGPVDAVERQELYRDLNARFGGRSLKASELLPA